MVGNTGIVHRRKKVLRHRIGTHGGQMQSSWTGWVAFLVLAALISVTSCQAYLGPDAPKTTTGASE